MNAYRNIGLTALIALGVAFPPPPVAAQSPEALAAWETYVQRTERRIGTENGNGGSWPSRVLDVGDGIRIEELETRDADGNGIDIPDAMVHHWRGVVLVPNVDLDFVLGVVQDPEGDVELQEDVLEARVLERSEDGLRVFLKLKRSKIVTAVYNTEHTVEYEYHGDRRASSRTVATKIAELDDPGSAEEREKPRGEDRGFLWKLNSYWHYEQVDGGVLVQCESISLSRSIPFLARPFVGPIVESIARESLERTLASLRGRLFAETRRTARR